MGSIYKRGEIYWIKYYRQGKPYRESTKSRKKADAKRLLKKREGEVSNGRLPGIYFDKVTFDELAEDFVRDRRVNGKNVYDAEKRLSHLAAVFSGYTVPNITTSRINEYVDGRMAEGAKNATINRELAALKRMLNLGAKETPPKVDRVPYIAMLKENNVRKGFFEHGDFECLRRALPSYLKGFVTFAYKTGWRESEITGLQWGQVDRNNGIVRLEVGETKNDEGRTLYLDEELHDVINRQWTHRKERGLLSPYVFPGKNGRTKMSDFRGAWNAACRETNMGYGYKTSDSYVNRWQSTYQPGPTLHDFRRTAVRNMVRSGIPERVAMMISGHKTRSVFDRYNIVSDTDLRMAAQRQEAYLQAQAGTASGTVHDLATKEGASRSG